MRNPLNLNNGRLSWILAVGLVGVLLAVFCTAGAADEGPRFTVSGFVIDGQSPIGAAGVERALAPYTGRPIVFADLEAAADALASAFLDAGYPFHRVSVPPQRIVEGWVRLKVVGYALKDVRVEENRHFDAENLLASLPPLEPGRTPNTLAVARALQFANQHPAKRVAVFVKQAGAGEGIDARVMVQDARPYTVFGSLNNTGTRDPARTRAGLGFQHSNLFNRDHILTATYTTSPESLDDVSQYGLDYRAPLYGIATELEFFYSYSEVDQGSIANFFDVSGRGQFYGFSATHTLLPIGAYSHKAALGYQDRFFDNETRFAGTSLIPDVRSTPVSLRYSLLYEPRQIALGAYAAWAFNAGFGSHNDSASYRANREGADPDWHKFNGGGHLRWTLPGDVQLRARIDGQYAGRPLISGEQFGVGGSASVRGYEERELTGDSGIQASFELWSPPLILDGRLALFADAGEVYRQRPHTAMARHQDAYSLGVGLRWNWKGFVDVHLDLAQALEDAITTESGDTRVLYRIFLRY